MLQRVMHNRDRSSSNTPMKDQAAMPPTIASTTSLMSWLKSHERLHVAWCVSGIVGCLLIYGVLQERIMGEQYTAPGGEPEHFKASLFIVFCNRVVTCVLAVTILVASGEQVSPQAPVWNYFAVSGSNVVATYCQYEALKYVSFPIQTLGKCAKMVPVMIWGTLVNQKVYKLKDYIIAVLVTGGCVMFVLTGSTAAKHAAGSSSMYGVALMVGYLGFDGFTSTWQDKMFKGIPMTIYNQILYVQACSAAVSMSSLVIFSQLVPAIQFLARHPDCMWNIIVLSVAATMAQLFISHTIKEFGALLFATVMTTRQFLSILLSCFLFAHPLTLEQWVASLIVFAALYYKNLSHGPKPDKAAEKGGDKADGAKADGKSDEQQRLLATK